MTITDSIAELKKLEKNYEPNHIAAKALRSKNLVFFVGPARVGKSTLMNELVGLDERFARIGGFTTRDPRPDDEPELYRYLPYNDESFVQILAQVNVGTLVQYAVHPTTGNVYATELSDYAGQFNCKDVLGHAMVGFRALPCATSYTFSIVCEPAQWLKRLTDSYKDESDPDLHKRIAEAKINLQWSLQDTETIWIDNSDGNLAKAAKEILKITTGAAEPSKNQQSQRRNTAKLMLKKLQGFMNLAI